MIYTLIIISCLLLSFYYDYKERKHNKNLWYYIMCGVFIFLAGLRYHIGIDSSRYEMMFEYMPDLTHLSLNDMGFSFAPGYSIFVSIVKSFSKSFIAFQIIHAAYVNIILFYFFKKYSSNWFLCTLIYFVVYYYFFNCEVLRESLAVATFLPGWKYFLKKKWTFYYIFSFLALSFHYSAAITLIFPIFTLKIFSKAFKVGWNLFFVIIITFIVAKFISVFFFDALSALDSISVIGEYSARYSNSEFYGGEKELNINGMITFTIKNIFYPFIALYILKKNYNFSNILQINAFQTALGIFFLIAIFSNSIRILQRFLSYLYPIITRIKIT